MSEQRLGYVAIVGQPNVGKSTLMNFLLGMKLSITSRKPQTTRHSILGINTLGDTQIVYVDTPGIHIQEARAMNRYLNRAAIAALYDVDLVVFMVSELNWNDQDEKVLSVLKKTDKPVILVLNKVDKIKDKKALLPQIEKLSALYDFVKCVPLSAKNPEHVQAFQQDLLAFIPQGAHHFEPDQLTDRNDRFVASEIVREKLMRSLGEELPYSISVTVEDFSEGDDLIKVNVIIWVERDSQKAIVIGKKGEKLKLASTEARKDMQVYFEKKVFLRCWVKVKKGWSDDERILNQLGYTE
jgi:GTPase